MGGTRGGGNQRVSRQRTSWGAYRRIADTLRRRIRSGEYATGTRIPSEADLCAEFGVTRNTVRRALATLEADGLIIAFPSLGRVVRDPNQASSGDAEDHSLHQYQRIAKALRARIETGELGAGDALPSDAEIVNQYDVSRYTARHAFAELERAGLVEAVHGKGRFVRRRRP